jgi:glycogen operon protein
MKGDRGTVSRFAARLLASPDLYGREDREPEQSINFITCHDGFTLNDLVSYNQKHNEANQEENTDGMNENLSWNCGVEGFSEDPGIEKLRNRQVKNFLAITLLALGAPMVLMGDEGRRTQRGNNNAYCQDNELSWFDWSLLRRHGDVHRFVKHLIAFRLRRDTSKEEPHLSLQELLRQAQVQWHGVELHRPDWGEDSHSLAFTVRSLGGKFLIHAIVNAYWEPLEFELPLLQNGETGWYRWIDTVLESPEDICDWGEAPIVPGRKYRVRARSVVVLFARMRRGG